MFRIFFFYHRFFLFFPISIVTILYYFLSVKRTLFFLSHSHTTMSLKHTPRPTYQVKMSWNVRWWYGILWPFQAFWICPGTFPGSCTSSCFHQTQQKARWTLEPSACPHLSEHLWGDRVMMNAWIQKNKAVFSITPNDYITPESHLEWCSHCVLLRRWLYFSEIMQLPFTVIENQTAINKVSWGGF